MADASEPLVIQVIMSSPCHPDGRLEARYEKDPPNQLRCSECGRVWLLGVCVPLRELILYSTQQALGEDPK